MVRILGETVRKGSKSHRILLAERRHFLRRQRDPQSSYYGVPISELLKSNRRKIHRNEALPGPYYVWMTDKFFSGWGRARGKLNKYVVKCDTLEQAECVFKNAEMRSEMRNVNYGRKLPYFSPSKYHVSLKTWDQLGYAWKTGCKWQNEDDYYADPRRMSPNRRRGLRRNGADHKRHRWQIFGYDVWGNAEDGWEVNNVLPGPVITMSYKAEYDKKTFDSAMSRARVNLRWALIDEGASDEDTIYFNTASGKPLAEMRRVK